MPVLTPKYGLVFFISDLDTEVIARVENRTSDLVRADIWLRDALIEISSNPDYMEDFDNLELWGPTFVLTPGVAEYSFSNFVPTDPTTGQITLNQATLSVSAWIDPPANTIRKMLRMSHYLEADRNATQAQAQPSFVYRYGDSLGFYPIPDLAYTCQARILQYHPIQDSQVSATQILLPREWNEILVWAATERGFMELLEFEKAESVHKLLFGDPRDSSKPGLISRVKNRRKKEIWRREQALKPRMRGYNYGFS